MTAPNLVIKGPSCFALTPEGKHIVVSKQDGAPRARLVDLGTGADLVSFDKLASNIRGLAVSADGEQVAFARMNEEVFLCDARTGATLNTAQVDNNGELLGIVFDPKSSNLVHGSCDEILVLDVATDETVGQLFVFKGLASHAPTFECFAFSRHGDLLAVGWNMMNFAGKVAQSVSVFAWPAGDELACFALKSASQNLTFSPDGKELFIKENTGAIQSWDWQAQKTTWKVARTSHDFSEAAVAFSPDGKRLAVAHANQVAIWDYQQRKILAKWPVADECYDLAFTRDGERLVVALENRIEVHHV